MSAVLPSLLIISQTYAIEEHAKKLRALEKHFQVLCVTVLHEDSGLPPRPEDGTQTEDSYPRLRLPVIGKVAWNRYFFRGLWQVLRSQRWDFVLAEVEPWLPLKWQSLLLSRLSGNVGLYGEFTWENVRRRGLKGSILEWVYKFSACWLDFWMAGNKAAAQILEEAGMERSRILVCTQVGVDVDHAPPRLEAERKKLRQRHAIPAGAFVVGFAGRLVKEKGIRDLAASVRLLRDEGGLSRDLHMVLMGAGNLRSEMEKVAESEPWLHLLPHVPYEEVASYLQIMDLLVLGSHPHHENGCCWEEQFGHILVEAMACGTLVAGSDSGAIPEVIGDPALIFPVGNVQALGAIIRRCETDEAFFEERRNLQARRVRAEYTHEQVALRYEAFFKSLTA